MKWDVLSKYFDIGCEPLTITDGSISESTEAYLLDDGTEAFHAHSLYLENLKKGTFASQYLLNPSVKFYEDLQFVVTAAILFTLLRFICSGAYIHSLRRYKSMFYLLAKHVLPVDKRKYYKFAESLWLCLWHLSSFTTNLYVLTTQLGTPENPLWLRMLLRHLSGRWFWFSTRWELSDESIGWPYIATPPAVHWFYLVEMGFWLSSAVYMTAEIPRGDFHATLVHHASTCILLGLSYIFSLWKIGLVILLLHDIVDIFLFSAKCFHYMFRMEALARSAFGCLVLTYFVSRLVIYPLLCVIPVVNIRIVRHDTCGIVQNFSHMPGYVIFPLCLSILWILHLYWFSLVLKVVWKLHTDSYSKGIRSGDEVSDDEVWDDES